MRSSSIAMAFGVALSGLVACSSPATHFFTLDPVAPAMPPFAAPATLQVRVDAVRLPAEFDRPELVEQTGTYTVTVHDFSRWSAPVGQMARRALTQDLLARLPAGSVVFPDAPKPADALGLDVSILSLGRIGDRAVIDVSWTMSSSADVHTVRLAPNTLRLEAPAGRSGPAATAAEMSALLGKLADAIAAQITLKMRGQAWSAPLPRD